MRYQFVSHLGGGSPVLGENDFSLLVNEDRTLNTFTGSQGNPAPGEGKHNLNTAVGGEQAFAFDADTLGASLSMWLKATFDSPSAPSEWWIFLSSTSVSVFKLLVNNSTKEITIEFSSSFRNSLLVSSFRESDNVGNYPFSVSGVWSNIIVQIPTFAQGNDIKLFSNGAELVPFASNILADAGTPPSASSVILGSTRPTAIAGLQTDVFGPQIFNNPFRGNLGHIGIWDVQLSQSDINEIVNPSTGRPFDLDLNVASGGYTNNFNLVQYWKPGAIADVNQFGKSFLSGGMNLQNGSDFGGFTAWTEQIPLANRVNDVPA